MRMFGLRKMAARTGGTTRMSGGKASYQDTKTGRTIGDPESTISSFDLIEPMDQTVVCIPQ